jgi:hypothetical protein
LPETSFSAGLNGSTSLKLGWGGLHESRIWASSNMVSVLSQSNLACISAHRPPPIGAARSLGAVGTIASAIAAKMGRIFALGECITEPKALLRLDRKPAFLAQE